MRHRHRNYIPTLFLEASVFNFYNYGKAGKKQRDTRILFDDIKSGKYAAYTSDAVIGELAGAPKEMYDEMKRLIDTYTIKTLPDNPLVDQLADIYIAKHIIPLKYREDAVHIATATINSLNCVVSFNMGHIVKPKTMIGAGFINLREGYRWIGLATPTEIIDYDAAPPHGGV
ncbi:hypothetical protein AGMMS50268_05820 [Spirochaetia bacterium]|nr:hypothetical protein AGMMS50268_05820 [Spirochaetia bacterium]